MGEATLWRGDFVSVEFAAGHGNVAASRGLAQRNRQLFSVGAAIIGGLTLIGLLWAFLRTAGSAVSSLHLGAETAVADRLMSEESPVECLKRHGIAVSGHSDDDAVEQTTVVVPAGQA